jgi:hydrogenase nickel incorporation protein HypA/HybF
MASAMDIVLEHARRSGASRVHRIVLRIGSLSGVEPEALRFAFDITTQNTLAAGATMEIQAVEGRAHCAACDADFAITSGGIASCPFCQSLSGDVRQGRELELATIEMS